MHLNRYMRLWHLAAVAVLFSVVTTGCFRQKTLSRGQLSSEFTKAVSLTAETELLAEFMRSGRSAAAFAQGHALSSQAESDEILSELSRATTDGAIARRLSQLKEILQAVSRQLEMLQGSPDDALLAEIAGRMEILRGSLLAIKGSL